MRIILYTLYMKTFNITEARKNLLTLVKNISGEGQSYEITVNGKPSVVLLATVDYENLLETIEILSDQATVKDLITSQKQFKKGNVVALEDLL